MIDALLRQASSDCRRSVRTHAAGRLAATSTSKVAARRCPRLKPRLGTASPAGTPVTCRPRWIASIRTRPHMVLRQRSGYGAIQTVSAPVRDLIPAGVPARDAVPRGEFVRRQRPAARRDAVPPQLEARGLPPPPGSSATGGSRSARARAGPHCRIRRSSRIPTSRRPP